MKISFVTNPGNLNLNVGYGVAGFNVVRSLQRLGHEVPFASPDAPVEIAFCQPDYSDWSSPDAYHIQYTPWESTILKPGWLEAFNENCDEVWATSPLIAQWYKEAGIMKPIYVYEHAVDSTLWTKSRRRRGDQLKILHVGEPAVRKGGQMAMEAFVDVFKNRRDVSLTIKAWTRSNIRVKKGQSIIGLPHTMHKNINTIYNDYSPEMMVKLFHEHHALVYPSWGEGFGFIPLESMATGMPTLVPTSWAPYAHHVHPDLAIESELVDSPWSDTHPGKMYRPTYDSLVRAYRQLDERYEELAAWSFRQSFHVTKDYDWDRKTEQAFRHIVERFS